MLIAMLYSHTICMAANRVTVCQTKKSNNEQVQPFTVIHIKSGVRNMPNENTETIWLELLNLKCPLGFQSEPVVYMPTTSVKSTLHFQLYVHRY